MSPTEPPAPDEQSPEPSRAGTTRRNALKLGVGAGVGVAAWAGGSITSLGATPVYAAGCTFVVDFNLRPTCRRLANANGDALYRYRNLRNSDLPTGYSIDNANPAVGLDRRCDQGWVATLNFPAGITCQVRLVVGPPACTGPVNGTQASFLFGPSSSGTLAIQHPPCITLVNGDTRPRYSITASCNTSGAPISCLN